MRRKLETQKDIEKKRKRNNLVIGVVMIVVLFGSIFGTFLNLFGSSSEAEALNYRGLPLTQQGNMFVLTVGEKMFYFMSNPNEVAQEMYDINITSTIQSYLSRPLYIDSLDYGAAQEIAQNMQGYPERLANGCIDEEDCVSEVTPIKTCEDNIIIVRESISNKVYQEENCIYIEATNEDMIKVTDAFLLKTLGLN